MDCFNVTVAELLKMFDQPECCFCSRKPDSSSSAEEWTIYNDHLIFCPDCARAEGLSGEEA